MYILNRTAQAFTFSAERLHERYKHGLYFWTFTFKSVPLDDDTAMGDWDTFRRRLCDHFEWLQGLRVCELHRSHGIHFHTMVNGRIPIRRVQKMVYGSGHLTGHNRYLDFGRMSVSKCDDGTVAYMCKYLTKQYRKDYNFWGRRRWGTIGGFEQTKCIDIEYDTPCHRNKPLLFADEQIDYAAMMLLSHYSNLWGDLCNWPAEHKMRVVDYATRRDKSNGDKETWRTGTRKRIDPDAIIWSSHVEGCGRCRCGGELCKVGLKLWQNSIFCEWRFPEDNPPNVTPCNNMPEGPLSEVEERDSEKIFTNIARQELPTGKICSGLQPEKVNGKWIYILRPRDMLQSVTTNSPF